MKIKYQIIITGMVCLSLIYITLIISGTNTDYAGYSIIAIIGLCMGVIVPAPRIDNRRGVLQW